MTDEDLKLVKMIAVNSADIPEAMLKLVEEIEELRADASRVTNEYDSINHLVSYIHKMNVEAGWWTDLNTGADLRHTTEGPKRNVPEMIALQHSELSEALEGYRKNLMDDKLPTRPMIEVEFADCLIRIFDCAGGLGLDLGGAIRDKLIYNAQRADHKPENRRLAGGKSI